MTDAEPELLEAVKKGDAPAVARLLDSHPALMKAHTDQGVSAILLAVYYRHPAIAEAFIERGATLNLFESCALGQLDRVRAILAADRAAVGSFSPDGHTPLGLACFFGHREVARFLVGQGADVNAQSKNAQKVAPLHAAAARNDTEMVEAMPEGGGRSQLPAGGGCHSPPRSGGGGQ